MNLISADVSVDEADSLDISGHCESYDIRNANCFCMLLFLFFFFFILLAKDCWRKFSLQPIRCCWCRWMSDLLSNVFPIFAAASFGLHLCEAKSLLICFVQIFFDTVRWILQWTGCRRSRKETLRIWRRHRKWNTSSLFRSCLWSFRSVQEDGHSQHSIEANFGFHGNVVLPPQAPPERSKRHGCLPDSTMNVRCWWYFHVLDQWTELLELLHLFDLYALEMDSGAWTIHCKYLGLVHVDLQSIWLCSLSHVV